MKKAIFIDGPSLFNMGRILGIGKFNYQTLCDLLKSIGTRDLELISKPLHVVPSHKLEDLRKNLVNAGFQVQGATSYQSQDDLVIKKAITELNPAEVSEIVLVSSDGDFFRSLKDKQDAGIKVYVVATEKPDPRNGRVMIADIMKNSFNFVELNEHKDQIMKASWVEREEGEERVTSVSQSHAQKDNRRVIKIELNFSGNSSAVASLWGGFSGYYCQVS